MSIKPAKVQFNGGELSPWLEGRVDVAQYDKTAKLCRNFVPLAEGCLKRRGGTSFIATTPEDVDVVLKIKTNPEEAVVLIDGVERNTIAVERGQTVHFEVNCAGYWPYEGDAVVVEDATIIVTLVSLATSCVLEIETSPEDAIVMIEGVERRRYIGAKNSKVSYKVSRELYETIEDTITLSEDEKLLIKLNLSQISAIYGDWGSPQYFVACAQVGSLNEHLKSFLIRFTRGYLVVVFSSDLLAPGASYEMWFEYSGNDGYNSVVLDKYRKFHLADLHVADDAFRYYNLQGELIFAIDLALSAAVIGWAVDEDKHYASYYRRYDGEINGHIINIKYDNKEVWSVRERTI